MTNLQVMSVARLSHLTEGPNNPHLNQYSRLNNYVIPVALYIEAKWTLLTE